MHRQLDQQQDMHLTFLMPKTLRVFIGLSPYGVFIKPCIFLHRVS